MSFAAWAGRVVAMLVALLISACTTASNTAVADLPTLADREAIEATLYRYARGLDRHDPDLYASAWSEDGVFDLGVTTYKGREQMRGIITGLIDTYAAAAKRGDPERQIFHMDTNSRIEFLAPDRAIHHAYYLTIARIGEGPEAKNTIIATGSTTDELHKIEGAWLIAKRTVMNNP